MANDTKLRWFDEFTLNYDHEPPSRVRARAEKYLRVLRPFSGRYLSKDVFLELSKAVAKAASNKTVRSVFHEELLPLFEQTLTNQRTVKLALAFAGGFKWAKKGKQIGLSVGDWAVVDALCRIKRADVLEVDARALHQVRLQLVVCNSIYAGEQIEVFFNGGKLSGWSRAIGCHDWRKGLRCSTPKLLIGCHVLGRLQRQSNKMLLHGISCDDKRLKENKRLLASRYRQHKPCPFNGKHDCIKCPLGVNQCERSCNPNKTAYAKSSKK